jgi:rod shape determining protein RodA
MSYSRQAQSPVGSFDRGLLALYTMLVVIGWFMIYTVGYDPEDPLNFFALDNNPGKQLFFMVLCFAMGFVVLMMDWAIWRTFAMVIYVVSIVILPGTLIFGHEVNGAHAWYQFGGFSFQPAEIAKFGTCLAMAAYLSSTGVNLREWRSRFIAIGIFMLPVVIVKLQEDTGSALVFFSFLLVLYREGLPGSWYVLGFGTMILVVLGLLFPPPYVVAGLMILANFQLIGRFKEKARPWWIAWLLTLILTIAWPYLVDWLLIKSSIKPESVANKPVFLLIPHFVLLIGAFIPNYFKKNNLIQRQIQVLLLLLGLGAGLVFAANFACYTLLAPHQQQRVMIWLKPGEIAGEARGKAYNILHSKMAIGSGGLFGKGPMQGNMTKLRYVPAQSTDFIFCTVGEEHGFIGVVSLILFFTLLLWRITVIAERQRSNFSRIYAYCVAGIIFIHFIINLGMTMGLFPIIGIPLPFVSSGGSSLIGFTLMVAVLLKLDSHRNTA